MAKKRQTPKKKTASVTLKPYVYADGRVKMFDPARYAKAVKASRNPKGWQAEQRARRKKNGKAVKAELLEALATGAKVNKNFLKLSARSGARTFLISDGASVAEMARWLGDPSQNPRRTVRVLQVGASSQAVEPVAFEVRPQSENLIAGNVAKWIVQVAALMLFGAEGAEEFATYPRSPSRNDAEAEEIEDEDEDEEVERRFMLIEVGPK